MEPRTIFRSPALRVLDVRCRSPRQGAGAERGGEPAHLALLRRGAFTYHLGLRAWVGDANTALLHRAGAAYRVGHPAEGGDEVTLLEPSPALLDELFPDPARVAWPTSPRAQLAHLRLHRALSADGDDALAAEEAALELLAEVTRPGVAAPAPSPRERRRVEAVKARLGAALDRNLPLSEVAAAERCSPFHLMRTFRAGTGLSVRGYRRQLRVRAALAALAEGERDLAALAVRLGFSHHAHLTGACRALLGAPPSRLRALLAPGARSWKREAPGRG